MKEKLTLAVDAAPLEDWIKRVLLLLEDVPKGVRQNFLRLIDNVFLELPVGDLFTTVVADDGRVVLGVGSGLEAIATAMRAFKGDLGHE